MYGTTLQRAEQDWRTLQRTSSDQQTDAIYEQDDRMEIKDKLVAALPDALLEEMLSRARASIWLGRRVERLTLPEVLQDVALRQEASGRLSQVSDVQEVLKCSLARTVKRSSHRQLFAGILSAGLWKSMRYVLQKMQKAQNT